MNRFPSFDPPCTATNTLPGFTRRESYSTPVIVGFSWGFPLWARTSTPSRRSRNVIAVIVLQVGKHRDARTKKRTKAASRVKILRHAPLVLPRQRNQHSRPTRYPDRSEHPQRRSGSRTAAPQYARTGTALPSSSQYHQRRLPPTRTPELGGIPQRQRHLRARAKKTEIAVAGACLGSTHRELPSFCAKD